MFNRLNKMQVPATFADGEWNTTQTIRDLKRYMIGDSLRYPSRQRKRLCARLVVCAHRIAHVWNVNTAMGRLGE